MFDVRKPLLFAVVAFASAVAADVAVADPGHDPVRHGRATLSAPAGATLPGASGRIEAEIKPARGHHDETARLSLKLRHLEGAATYTLWGTDPVSLTLTQFGEVTAKEDGNADFKLDTKHGDSLPFGATLDDLAGGAVEVHDAAGGVALSGNFPAILPPKGPPLKGRAELTAPSGAPFPDASGRIETRFENGDSHHDAKSQLKIKLRHLGGSSHYTLWGLDPASATLTQFGEVTTKKDGNADFKLDTHHGDSLPFGASLDALAGGAVEIRDDAGAVVLSGNFPSAAAPGPKSDGKAELTSNVPGAQGRIEVGFKAADGHHDAESTLKITLEKLSGDTEYTLWGLDPATATLTQFASVTTKKDGRAEFKVETKHGDALPFGATLADLTGTTLEVHDSSGAVVLFGTFPAPKGSSDVPAPPPPPTPVTGTGHSDLTATVAGPTGTIDTVFNPATTTTAESSQVTVALHGLTPATLYSLWTVNPTTLLLEPFASVEADVNGDASLLLDTSVGDTLPLGGTLDLLAGAEFEVHDPAANVVLSGNFPVTQ